MMSLQERLAGRRSTALAAESTPEDDGALTVHHDGTFASLRVVTSARGWTWCRSTRCWPGTCRWTTRLARKVAEHASDTLLGTVSLVEKERCGRSERARRRPRMCCCATTFPASGLTDEALGTLIMMVLSTGADVRRTLIA